MMRNKFGGESFPCEDRSESSSKKRALRIKEIRRARSAMFNALERYDVRFTEMVPGEYEAIVSLGLEVVNQAVQDYREASECLRKYPHSLEAKDLKADAAEFFESGWCCLLAGGIDGTAILRTLEQEQCGGREE